MLCLWHSCYRQELLSVRNMRAIKQQESSARFPLIVLLLKRSVSKLRRSLQYHLPAATVSILGTFTELQYLHLIIMRLRTSTDMHATQIQLTKRKDKSIIFVDSPLYAIYTYIYILSLPSSIDDDGQRQQARHSAPSFLAFMASRSACSLVCSARQRDLPASVARVILGTHAYRGEEANTQLVLLFAG